jgi:hypothetical protein
VIGGLRPSSSSFVRACSTRLALARTRDEERRPFVSSRRALPLFLSYNASCNASPPSPLSHFVSTTSPNAGPLALGIVVQPAHGLPNGPIAQFLQSRLRGSHLRGDAVAHQVSLPYLRHEHNAIQRRASRQLHVRRHSSSSSRATPVLRARASCPAPCSLCTQKPPRTANPSG